MQEQDSTHVQTHVVSTCDESPYPKLLESGSDYLLLSMTANHHMLCMWCNGWSWFLFPHMKNSVRTANWSQALSFLRCNTSRNIASASSTWVPYWNICYSFEKYPWFGGVVNGHQHRSWRVSPVEVSVEKVLDYKSPVYSFTCQTAILRTQLFRYCLMSTNNWTFYLFTWTEHHQKKTLSYIIIYPFLSFFIVSLFF